MCVSFWSKLRPRPFGCVAIGSTVLFILGPDCSYILQGGVNRVLGVLSGFSVRLFCFVQAKTLCMFGCMYFLATHVLVCVDLMVMSYAYAMT